ncbi:MAG: hypothetical protein ACRDZZ_03245 [Ilumatobacteraceae bacterium]
MRWAGRQSGRVFVAFAAVGALVIHRHFPWIPLLYLGALIALPVIAWRMARWQAAPRPLRWSVPSVAVMALVALCPVPWMKADLDHPPGSAWKLDGRLAINGTDVDPPGTWYWLTVGRPPIVAEVVGDWLSTDTAAATSMRQGRLAQRPAISEPSAAAIGLRRAGWPIELTVLVEVSGALDDRLPDRAVLASVNRIDLAARSDWERALAGLGGVNTFTTDGGDSFEYEGADLPYRRVDVIDIPRDGLEAAIGGRLARTLPGSWWRDLSLGRSHGLMVAIVSYVYGSGEDLADGRAIAGTGTIRGDGSVGSIGGLVAKATAARDVGADVLLFPAQQADQLDGFDPGLMQLVPVASLDEAVEALAR